MHGEIQGKQSAGFEFSTGVTCSNPPFIQSTKKEHPLGVPFFVAESVGFEPTWVAPNGFQGTLTTRKLENFRGR